LVGLSSLAQKQHSTWQLINAPPRLQQATVSQRAARAASATSGPMGSSASRGDAASVPPREAERHGNEKFAPGRSSQPSQQAALTSLSAVPIDPQSWDTADIYPSTSAPAVAAAASWADRHAPRSLDELLLALNRKKVQEVQDWLEHQRTDRFRPEYCRLMIVTGVRVHAAVGGVTCMLKK